MNNNNNNKESTMKRTTKAISLIKVVKFKKKTKKEISISSFGENFLDQSLPAQHNTTLLSEQNKQQKIQNTLFHRKYYSENKLKFIILLFVLVFFFQE